MRTFSVLSLIFIPVYLLLPIRVLCGKSIQVHCFTLVARLFNPRLVHWGTFLYLF
jgi:hypothetical protein